MKDYYYERVENYHFNRVNGYARSYSRRARELRLLKIVFMFFFFLMITFSIIFSIKKATYANEIDNSCLRKQYKSITIYCGDTLEDIASNNFGPGYKNESKLISEICHINHITTSTKLIPGNYIIIPYYEEL